MDVWDCIWMDSDASFKYLDHLEIVNFVLKNVKNVCADPIICDIGGGTGYLLKEVGEKISINMDISKIPLEISKRRGIHSIIGSATHICIRDHVVDIVLCNFTLGYLLRRDLVLREIWRILNKEGRCIFLLHHSQSKSLFNLKRKKKVFIDLLELSRMLESPTDQNLDKVHRHLRMLLKEEVIPKIVTRSAIILLERYLRNPKKQAKALEELTLMFKDMAIGTSQIEQYETLFRNSFSSLAKANEFFQKRGFEVKESKIFFKDEEIAAIGLIAIPS